MNSGNTSALPSNAPGDHRKCFIHQNSYHLEHSSGNVFADLGLPNPEEHLVKATIGLAIAKTIWERKLTQEHAGTILGLAQPKVSNLIRGELDKFSLDRLLRYMRKLDYDVTISFAPKPKSREVAVIHVEGAPGWI